MTKAWSEARCRKSLRGASDRKHDNEGGKWESVRASSHDVDPKPKPRTWSFWYTREIGCLCVRGTPKSVIAVPGQLYYRDSGGTLCIQGVSSFVL